MQPEVLEKVEKIKDMIIEEVETFNQYRLTGSLSIMIHIQEGRIRVVDVCPKNTMKL